MQQPGRAKPQHSSDPPSLPGGAVGRVRTGALLGLAALGPAALALALAGCGGPSDTALPGEGKKRPFEGVALTLSCPDPVLAAAIAPLAKTWAAGAGATVEVSPTPMAPGDAMDAAVVLPNDLAIWADRGELLPVPAALKEAGHPYQWSSVLAVYRGEQFAGWGGQVVGVPLAGDSSVLVYRADRLGEKPTRDKFQQRAGRELTVPAAWEDLAAAAAFFTELDGRPSLPAPTGPALVDDFCRVAACYDHRARSEGAATATGPETLAFQFRLDTGKSRLDTPGFVEAAKWLGRLKPSRGTDADPVDALVSGRAVFALVSLADIGRLRAALGAAKLGRVTIASLRIAPLPGTTQVFDPTAGKFVAVPANYVPYIAGGRLGVVRKSCGRPEAAFELLAELGGPGRSLELVGTPGLGVGPFRDSHLDRERMLTWYAYGFDDERTRSLQDALRSFAGKAVKNPTFGLRGPDQAALTAALADELKKVAAGEVGPEEGLKRAAAAWEKLDAATAPDRLHAWRRKAVGLVN